MKSWHAHRPVNLLIALPLLLWVPVAIANAGVGFFFLAIPVVVLALIPTVIVEALVLMRLLQVSIWRGLFLTTVANLTSTILGVIGSIALDFFLVVGLGSSGLPLETVTAATMLVPFFLFSWWIEYHVIVRCEADKPKERIRKATGLGNLISYILIVAFLFLVIAPFVSGYGGYTVRSTVTEGLSLASAGKTAVSEFFARNGRLPINNEEAGVADPESISGNSVDKVQIANGVITVTFSTPRIAGSTINLTPDITGGKVLWDCTGGDLENRLPSLVVP